MQGAYEFPVAIVTNDYRLGGLKQCKFILSEFRRPEVQHQGIIRATFSLDAPREDPSLYLPGSGGPRLLRMLWLMIAWLQPLVSVFSGFQVSLCLSHRRTSVIGFQFLPESQTISSQDPSLQPEKTLLPNKVTFTGYGVRAWTCL